MNPDPQQYVIGYIGKPTKDGRIVTGVTLDRPAPIIYPGAPNTHEGGDTVGQVTAIAIEEDRIMATVEWVGNPYAVAEHMVLSMDLDTPPGPPRDDGVFEMSGGLVGCHIIQRWSWAW